MAVAARTLDLQAQARLSELASRCINALVLDDVWTAGAANSDAFAGEIGTQLTEALRIIESLLPTASEVLLRARHELNVAWQVWPGRSSFAPGQLGVLDEVVAQQGGSFGDAAFNFSQALMAELPDEIVQLRERMSAIESTGGPAGDMRKLTKVLLAWAAGAALIAIGASVGAVLVGPVAAAALVATKDIAIAVFSIAATGAFGTLVPQSGPAPPPTG